MPLYLGDNFFLNTNVKACRDCDYVQTHVTSNTALDGTNRVILCSITLPTSGKWYIFGNGAFSHPTANKYLYTWIDKSPTLWTSTEWDSFISDTELSSTFNAVKFEDTNDYTNIAVNTIVTIATSTTFNWSFTTDDTTASTNFFNASNESFDLDSNRLLYTVSNTYNKSTNQAQFIGIKMFD